MDRKRHVRVGRKLVRGRDGGLSLSLPDESDVKGEFVLKR